MLSTPITAPKPVIRIIGQTRTSLSLHRQQQIRQRAAYLLDPTLQPITKGSAIFTSATGIAASVRVASANLGKTEFWFGIRAEGFPIIENAKYSFFVAACAWDSVRVAEPAFFAFPMTMSNGVPQIQGITVASIATGGHAHVKLTQRVDGWSINLGGGNVISANEFILSRGHKFIPGYEVAEYSRRDKTDIAAHATTEELAQLERLRAEVNAFRVAALPNLRADLHIRWD